jgi:hypothetical protein
MIGAQRINRYEVDIGQRVWRSGGLGANTQRHRQKEKNQADSLHRRHDLS